jgi:hypothetical protein
MPVLKGGAVVCGVEVLVSLVNCGVAMTADLKLVGVEILTVDTRKMTVTLRV